MTQPLATGKGDTAELTSFDTGNTNPGSLDQLARTLTAPLAVLSRAVPAGPIPVALGTGALAVAGVIEWPIAAAVGLGYLALRRWR